ncbi:hypothetical protein [Bernardetia sp.]|uniref:hypothetical protein n=1 Tax=Bernardetia sp. TaxID=1937974 RepID=UPI0025BF764D|nr:hypothetical protein [Bernardetia sp.]
MIKEEYEWYVELEGEVIGELINAEYVDMFWYEYIVIPNKNYEYLISDIQLWNDCKFKFFNKVSLKYANNAFGHYLPLERKAYMRALYIDERKNNFFKRLFSFLYL